MVPAEQTKLCILSGLQHTSIWCQCSELIDLKYCQAQGHIKTLLYSSNLKFIDLREDPDIDKDIDIEPLKLLDSKLELFLLLLEAMLSNELRVELIIDKIRVSFNNTMFL